MTEQTLPLIGWREYLSLPDLGLHHIKAKIDTGARSSALHALDITYEERDGECWVRFLAHPRQFSLRPELICHAPVLEKRTVRNSGGEQELRPVIRTCVSLPPWTWPIELTLTSRDEMKFRMLLGREAVRRRFWINPGASFVQSARHHHSPLPVQEEEPIA